MSFTCHLCSTPLIFQDGFWGCPTHTLEVEVNGKVLYRALPKQWEYHMAPEPWVLFGGAAGGTKSHGGRWDLILAGLEIAGMPMLLLRRNLTELRNTHILTESGDGFSQLPRELGEWRVSDKQFHLPNGSYIQCGYCESDKDFAQYLSTAWGRVFLDEGSQFTPWMVEMLDTRVRSAKGYRTRFGIGSNPGGPLHQWLKNRFVERQGSSVTGSEYIPEDYRFIPAKVDDNPYYAGTGYVEKLERLAPLERKMYREGSWDLPMGNLFAELDAGVHLVDGVRPWPSSRRVICADWGWEAKAPALWVETDKGLHGAPYSRVYREWIPNRTIPAQWAAEVCARSEGEGVEVCILDSAAFDPRQDGGPSMAEQMMPTFRKHGIRLIPAIKGPGSIDRGVQILHTYFWTDGGKLTPLLTFHRECRETWEAVVTIQRGDATKHQDVDLPAPHAPQLHIVDSLRYWASSRPKLAELSTEDRLQADPVFAKAMQDDATRVEITRKRIAEAAQKGQMVPPKAPPLQFPKQTRKPWERR